MIEYHQHLDVIECKIDDGSSRHLPAGRIPIRILTGVGPEGRTPLAINIAEADHDVDDPSSKVLLELLEARRLLEVLSERIHSSASVGLASNFSNSLTNRLPVMFPSAWRRPTAA